MTEKKEKKLNHEIIVHMMIGAKGKGVS